MIGYERGRSVHGDVERIGQLAISTAGRAPLSQIVSGAGEFLDSIVERVCNVDVAVRIDVQAGRCIELAIAVSSCPPLRHECTRAREFLYTVVLTVEHVDVSTAVDSNVTGKLELTCSGA